VEAKDYEEVRDIREELLQVLRLLEEEDLSLLVCRFCARIPSNHARGTCQRKQVTYVPGAILA
jgi:hypothetical protein